MAHSYTRYVFNGTRTDYPVSFTGGYRTRSNVSVVRVTDDNYIVEMPVTFDWLGTNNIRINISALSAGDTIEIRRTVSKQQPPVDLLQPGNLTREAVEAVAIHALQVCHEILDGRIAAFGDLQEFLENAYLYLTRAQAAATTATAQANRAEVEANRAESAAAAIETLASVLGNNNQRKSLAINDTGDGFRVRNRNIKFVLCYTQSNGQNNDPGEVWEQQPPDNAYMWNGGTWNGDMEPPLGDAFVRIRATQPRVPSAYVAELARSDPETDYYLVIVARGGTPIRNLAGMRYVYEGAAGAPTQPGRIVVDFGNLRVRYHERDLLNQTRFLGGTYLGQSDFYPAVIENAISGNSRVRLMLGTGSDQGAYRQQSLSLVDSISWPPAPGTEVRVYPHGPYMKDVLMPVINRAMDALGWTGEQRKIDHILHWPTEGDMSYPESYETQDFPWFKSYISSYLRANTEWTFTLPWPYGTGLDPTRTEWWAAIRRIAASMDMAKVVSLTQSGSENWGDDNLIHAKGQESVGTYVARSAQRGGSPIVPVASGFYTPVVTNIDNGTGISVSEAAWVRVGDVVTVSGFINARAEVANVEMVLGIPLPIPSNFAGGHQLTGMSKAVGNPEAGSILGDTAVNRAVMRATIPTVLGRQWTYTFTYRIRNT